MLNAFLKDKVAADIDKKVNRVLRELGDPAPPLRLEEVRAILELDRQYYSRTNTGRLHETVHRLKVSGKQVIRRPALLLEAVKKFDLRALYLPDSKQILLDAEIPTLKQRWSEAHEIGHDIIDWHHEMMLGDNRLTLKPNYHVKLEAEANFAAGRLLFFGDHLSEILRDSSVTIERIRCLAKDYFGNTITTTFWRSIEHILEPAVGLISCHPAEVPADVIAGEEARYFIRNQSFIDRFNSIEASYLFSQIANYCRRGRGPLGEREIILKDNDGHEHIFFFETFYNGHDALSLGTYQRKRKVIFKV